MIRAAIIGLGRWGRSLVNSVHGATDDIRFVAAHTRTRAKAEPLAAQGATIADTPAAAARDADVVISILADDNASRAAWTGENGALAAMRSGSIIVECGTLSPEWIGEFHKLTEARGVGLVEAPVTGSRPQAAAGQLTFLCGAEEATLACDLFVAIGSSLKVFPAAGFPIIAKRNGARLVILNREPTELDRIADLVIHDEIGPTLGAVAMLN